MLDTIISDLKFIKFYTAFYLSTIADFIVNKNENSSFKHPNPTKNRLILDSVLVKNNIGHRQSIEFVEKYNFGAYTNALNILYANKELQNEAIWLSYMNRYFTTFKMSPIDLKNSPNSKYKRLCSHSNNIQDKNTLISVIITSYNSCETIKHSIASIQNQTWKNLEIIIIDDNSSDNTWDIISELASSDNRIKAYRNNVNIGSYVSKNIALKLVNGKYFTCHDSDDWSHPERISKQVASMEKDKAKASIILMLRAKPSMEITRFHRINKSCIDGVSRYSLISCMFKSEYFRENLGGWDSVRVNADSELYERANLALGRNFKKYKVLGLVCLDAENSLTNHPAYGTQVADKNNSPRKQYSTAYRLWHKSLKKNSTYLEFPHTKRKFTAPDMILTPSRDIESLLDYYKSNYNI